MFASFVPFCFSIICVSLVVTKLLHLYLYITAVSPFAFILYFASLCLPDLFVICLSRLALQREKGIISIPVCVLGCIFAFILLCAAASQIGFVFKTGSEIQWSDALSYAADKDGMKVLLSGTGAVLSAGLGLLVVSWFAKGFLYRVVGALLVAVGTPIIHVVKLVMATRGSGTSRPRRNEYSPAARSDPDQDDDSEFLSEDEESRGARTGLNETEWKDVPGQVSRRFRQTTSWTIFAVVVVFLTLTTMFRPQIPYSMMSTSLPFAMLEAFKTPDPCAEQGRLNGNRWPFPALIKDTNWEPAHGHYKGWAPGSDSELVAKYRQTVPSWLPSPPPLGFAKWDNSTNTTTTTAATKPTETAACGGMEVREAFYNPVNDPMKISNLDMNILDEVQEALKNNTVKIKHVALVIMESLREELFPLQHGSDIYKIIMESHEEGNKEAADRVLAGMSVNAEKITGKPGNFKTSKDPESTDPTPQWKDTTRPGYGGINVVGGYTTASLSMKSLAANHCGAWPMPVDMFEESESTPYQACIPNVLELFNSLKQNKSTKDFREQQWRPVLFQSITDEYDRQDKFDKKAGFKHVVTKQTLDAELDHSELEEINYFGYPETTLKKHLRKYIESSKKNNHRMFLSHITSTTHHPWALPAANETLEYLHTGGSMRWHNDFNKFLNTVHFTDAWLGELMQMFEDTGIANETLVVFIGDHGQAFKEDTPKTGTYENGHVSNFRVPITFRHPNIPRVQYNANATSISILPTILDLLINTGSLNKKDTEAASDLIQDYEGQSLIRPYKASHNGRRAWNFGMINAGGRMLSVTSADAPWRLVMPLDEKSEYHLTDLKNDPLELKPILEWSLRRTSETAKSKFGQEAADWVIEAEGVARWWALERKRLWGYHGKS